MFKTRLISGIVLVLVALVTIISGGPILFATILMISLIGMQELNKAMGVREDKFNALEIAGYIGIIGYDFLIFFHMDHFGTIALIGALILLMFVYVFTYPKYHAEQVMATYFGIIYVGVMLSFVYQTRMLEENGKFLVWLISCALGVVILALTVWEF